MKNNQKEVMKMGEEGELKKRIAEYLRERETSQSLDGQEYGGHGFVDWTVVANGVANIVDEAKKDFPIIGWKYEISHDLTEEECEEAYEWFLKWFLGVKKE